MGVDLMGVYLMGVHLMGVHLIGVYFIGVYIIPCTSNTSSSLGRIYLPGAATPKV